ncbi:MAG TPA: histone deacetylase [Spirochaetes bacterium]|nr:histone deacetylase [Spirochaetota bacterium]
MKIIFSEKCLEYNMPGHPESPERVMYSHKYLKEKGYTFVEPSPCLEEDALSAHSNGLVEKVKKGDFSDFDTPALPDIYDHALLAAGAAIEAMEIAAGGESVFSLMRPPGHHATKNNLGGFCYFNNMAISVKKTLRTRNRAAIIDIDCHHGNGTEDIFLSDSRVLFISLHQSPLYPGTGLTSRENCLNYPLKPNTDVDSYLGVLEEALEKVRDHEPDIIGVSAGFDTYKNDPITNLMLDFGAYHKIGELFKELSRPLFTILEGGYDKDIPLCIESYLEGIDG